MTRENLLEKGDAVRKCWLNPRYQIVDHEQGERLGTSTVLRIPCRGQGGVVSMEKPRYIAVV